MSGDRIEMSQAERDRLKVMSAVLEGRRTQVEAGRLLGLCERQVRRIQRRLEREGDAGIVHRQRGRPSHRAKASSLRQEVLAVYRQEYSDFGPTLAVEKLSALGLVVDSETLRRWLLAEGLWKRQRRRDRHRQRRERRECYGELVQADGSHHDWLEGRGEEMVLLVMIDDATSKTLARFFPAEDTEGYMDLLGRYLRKRGRMVGIYADRHSVFFAQDAEGNVTLTQFGRALRELGIELIPAGSPQAKGRVERFNGTAQDRLVKELRLAGARTIPEANAVLDKTFLPWFNSHCAVKPASPNNAHRPLHPSLNLAAILCQQETRTVANDYTIRLQNSIYQILPPALPGLRGGQVTIEHRKDGRIRIRFKGQYLTYKVFGKSKASGALPPNPRSLPLGLVPAEVRKSEGQAAATAGPSAVHQALGRSGRTPAEPCPPKGPATVSAKHAPGPARRNKWMDNFRLPGSNPKRTFLSS